MMKHFGKKLLSLGLVAIMMVTMIPMGVFTATGLDYTQSEFTIANLTDWNAIAASSENFSGKTVKLTANIDAGGTQVATLFDTFAGTFDGQGFTVRNFKATNALLATQTTAGAVIKNVGVEGRVDGAVNTGVALLVGSHDGTGSLTVSNVSVGGVVASTGKHAGGVIGVLTLKDAQAATIEKVSANVTVSNTKAAVTNEMSGSGGVIGIFEPIGKPELTIKAINLSGSVVSKASVGGVVGAIFSTKTLGSLVPNDNDNSWNNGIDNGVAYAGNDKSYLPDITSAELYAGGTVTIANCQSAMTLSTDVATELVGAGGIVGTFGGFKRYFGDVYAFDGELNINNCVIGGSIENTSGASHPSSVGGVLGAMSYSHAKVNVDHCLVTASFPTNSLTGTKGEGAGLILGTSGCQTLSSLNVNNTVTTADSFALIGSIIAKAGGGTNVTGAWLVFNGRNLSSTGMPYNFLDEDEDYLMYSVYAWNYSASVTDTSVLAVTQECAASMVKTDDAGFIKRVGGQITALAVQDNVPDGATLTAEDTYAIRFIAVTQVTQISTAKMTVVVRNTETGKAFKKYDTTCRLYDALNAYDVNGAKIAYYKAIDFGAKKFLALTIGGIPGGTAYTFEITPSYTTLNGITVTGETISIRYDENGQYVLGQASFDVAPLVLAPTVRVMSSNIMIEDPVTYNLDDVSNTSGETYDHRYDVDGVEDIDLAKADETIYKNGQTYYWYFRDDTGGETIGRINKVAGTGWNITQRLEAMAQMYLTYDPDFIGLQEVTGSPTVNGEYYYPEDQYFWVTNKRTMQSVLLEKMGSNYAYVDFTDKVAVTSHTTPIMYRSDKWTVIDKDIDTTTNCNTDCGMHRWQWAQFQSIANPDYTVIVVNFHGPTKAHGYDSFFAELNGVLKELEELYPDSAIMMTGDYNQASTSQYVQQLLADTTMSNSLDLTPNADRCTADIDHICVTGERATVKQLRVVANSAGLSRATDHPNVFADILLAKSAPKTPSSTLNPGVSMDWNDGAICEAGLMVDWNDGTES